jgi:hypothetical protein
MPLNAKAPTRSRYPAGAENRMPHWLDTDRLLQPVGDAPPTQGASSQENLGTEGEPPQPQRCIEWPDFARPWLDWRLSHGLARANNNEPPAVIGLHTKAEVSPGIPNSET